jgi:hypothetical protein
MPADARIIAFYLPQYMPNADNDRFWGAGFTEWTHVAAARPLFRGHQQPNLPGELGFYDLRVEETREAQAELARHHGIEAFCYWHYWFAGRRVLERPFEEVLRGGRPRFPFCLAWANGSWTGIWHGAPERVLIEQTYPGRDDHERHFDALLPAFADERYLRVDGKPLFLIHHPRDLPCSRAFSDLWRERAERAGLGGLYLVGIADSVDAWHPHEHGLDAVALSYQSRVMIARHRASLRGRLEHFLFSKTSHSFSERCLGHGLKRVTQLERIFRSRRTGPRWIFPYAEAMRHFLAPEASLPQFHPVLVPGWDNSPRCGRNALVLKDSTPELFAIHARETLRAVAAKPRERRLVFLKSWNEWAEGNYLEPDRRHGRAYLEALRDAVYSPTV